MQMNFRGLVDLHSLPSNEPLLPLYEAIVNSIQSIEDSKKDGFIDIAIVREPQLTLLDTWETDIEDIIIKDNGIGFTDNNMKSFDTYASDFKIRRGCKGVGRIMWLKAFNCVEVESIYSSNGSLFRRKFSFNTKNEVHNLKNEPLAEIPEEMTTSISLIGYNSKLKKNTPKKLITIAREIINHCFIYFVSKGTEMPKIILRDSIDSININSLFNEYVNENLTIDEFNIQGNEFKIVHSRNYKFPSSNHTLNLCAHSRKVTSTNLASNLGNIENKFTSEIGEFSYSGYIVSPLLDKNVNKERTDFNMLKESNNELQDVGKQEIIDRALKYISVYLQDDIAKYNNDKKTYISNYIFEKHPRYRYLLKNYPELINSVSWTTDDEKLEVELFKQEQAYKLKLKMDGNALEKEIKNTIDVKEAINKKTELASKITDIGKSNLSEYILHRKTVLEILDSNLQYLNDDDRKYAYEKSIHEIIFPMQKTSDEVDYQSHNLWIIDEKLAYHNYLASDLKLKKLTVLESESGKEPDIIIFNSPFAFCDEDRQPFRNITIVEFKRPGRENYSDDENPIQQIIDYMDEILTGKIKTRDGRYIEQNENVRFYCYILCDLEDKIKKYAKVFDFKLSPDGMGFYKYLDNYKALVEIIPYTKLIQDSKQRNKILFDKLFNQL